MLAAVAPDRALEEMVVGAGASACAALGEQHLLDAVEQLGADDRFVTALVFDALVGDVSQVVAVTEHLSDLGD
ncbi:hypothetical protein ACWENQ_39770 [Nonomuraea sp. NPDC004354]